jgi:hypothetical protein
MEHLQHASKVPVRRHEIAALEPRRVARHAQGRFRRLARKGQVEKQHVLFGSVAFDGMDGEEIGGERAQADLGQLARTAPASVAAVPLAGQRRRSECFPTEQRTRTRVGRDQPVQHGRARALEAGDHDRRSNVDVRDLGMSAHEGLDA